MALLSSSSSSRRHERVLREILGIKERLSCILGSYNTLDGILYSSKRPVAIPISLVGGVSLLPLDAT